MNDKTRDLLSNKYCVMMEPQNCPKCQGACVAMYFKYNDTKKFEVRASCTQCGHQWTLPRVNVGDENELDMLNEWSRRVKARDEYRCRLCGKAAPKHLIQAHHIVPRSHDPEKRYWFNLNNGITLCLDCHVAAHGEWMNKYRKENE